MQQLRQGIGLIFVLSGWMSLGAEPADLFLQPDFQTAPLLRIDLEDPRVGELEPTSFEHWQQTTYTGELSGYVRDSRLNPEGGVLPGTPIHIQPDGSSAVLATVTASDVDQVAVEGSNLWWAKVKFTLPVLLYVTDDPQFLLAGTGIPPTLGLVAPIPQNAQAGQSIGYTPRGVAEELAERAERGERVVEDAPRGTQTVATSGSTPPPASRPESAPAPDPQTVATPEPVRPRPTVTEPQAEPAPPAVASPVPEPLADGPAVASTPPADDPVEAIEPVAEPPPVEEPVLSPVEAESAEAEPALSPEPTPRVPVASTGQSVVQPAATPAGVAAPVVTTRPASSPTDSRATEGLAQTFEGTFQKAEGRFFRRPDYPYEIVNQDGERVAFVSVEHLVISGTLSAFLEKRVVIHGPWEPATKKPDIVVHAQNIRLQNASGQ